ncbi:MAG: hypothetical protein IRY85_06495 [Micromonosporaceae bacterium]|nr:hypothetical protein [Micromonosporaceae bacterium]
MSQPEETSIKTSKTDDVIMRPNENPDRRVDQIPPQDKEDQGRVRVEREGELRPADEPG